jgi:hypothetical protein
MGFLIWLNYGWMWDYRPWKSTQEVMELSNFGDVWEWRGFQLSSPAATNCGRVRFNENPSSVTECGLKAFRKSQPFRVRYDFLGTDTYISAGLIYTPGGRLFGLVSYDEGQSRRFVETALCPSPLQVYITRNGRLNCFGKESVQPPNIMGREDY